VARREEGGRANIQKDEVLPAAAQRVVDVPAIGLEQEEALEVADRVRGVGHPVTKWAQVGVIEAAEAASEAYMLGSPFVLWRGGAACPAGRVHHRRSTGVNALGVNDNDR
jgi:hypothetical protein